MKNNSTELFPIIDEQGHTIGKATRKECHNGSKLLHPVIHLQIFNKYGNLYLQSYEQRYSTGKMGYGSRRTR